MASPRRPTYKAARPPARPAGQADGERPEVISASKAAAGFPGTGDTGRDTGGSEAAPDNVLTFPEPKAKRRRRHLLAVIGVITVLTAAIVAAAVYSPWLALRTVTVQGNELVGAEQIQTALAPLQGKPLPQVSDADVADLLKPLVAIKDVNVQARPPSTLQVRITERIPVALVKQGESYQLVDVDGVQLSTTLDPDSVPLPVIDGGEAPGGPIGAEVFSTITAVLGALPADVLAKLSDASAASVDAVELKLEDGQKIVWGNAGEKELKARVLAALLTVPADPANPVRIYDVSVPRHPVTR